MNSLNLLSSRVIGQSPLGSRQRSHSQGEALRSKLDEELLRGRSYSEDKIAKLSDPDEPTSIDAHGDPAPDGTQTPVSDIDDEKQPLLSDLISKTNSSTSQGLRYWIKRLADALTALLATIGLPVVYVTRCFQDEEGRYSPLVLFQKKRKRKTPVTSESSTGLTASTDVQWSEKPLNKAAKLTHSYSSEDLSSATSESENDQRHGEKTRRTKEVESREESKQRRQSPRIKLLHNDEAVQKRKRKSALSERPMNSKDTPMTMDNIKSPTSTSLRVTRYPHAPQPPRPLVPRRQPSYSNLIPRSPSRAPFSGPQQKTLVLDLDETLIHSMAKGGRMSSGHMVEVKLNVPVALPPTQTGQQAPAVIGPQHPILYYVHKRPHCDEFLRKVCKWYKLVVFTASVQEYADPVINWLEQERKYFQGRYYRQHCTFRNGNYIKDLSSIEPDLSKVVILDNSPVSYIFHEDNAIPIEGWINDPTDNDLLHLIPLLEALQYVNDVRALLALRRGEAEVA